MHSPIPVPRYDSSLCSESLPSVNRGLQPRHSGQAGTRGEVASLPGYDRQHDVRWMLRIVTQWTTGVGVDVEPREVAAGDVNANAVPLLEYVGTRVEFDG